MFQLIFAVISIALLAALAGASIFYGGAAFSGSTAKANVSSLVNQGQQIAGAAALFRTDNGGTTPTDIATQLVANDYLQSVPTPPTVGDASTSWGIGTDGTISYVFVRINDDAVPNTCAEVTNQNGGTAAATTAIVDPLTDVILTVGVPYNCVGADATATYFVYRM